MRTNAARFVWWTLLALAFTQVASAYTYIFDNTTLQPILWRPTAIPMLVRVGTTPTTRDTDYNHAVLMAMDMWNSTTASTQLVGTIDGQPPPAADHDHVNEIFFANDIYGTSFGNATLAVTTAWSYANNSRSEADIIFNANTTLIIGGTSYPLSWDSYAGPQQGTKFDIRRVALHELGHVLGMDHPDQAGQSVTAIMNSTASSIETLQADDITGVQHLYGALGGAAPANDNFANATLVNESDGRPYSGSNIYPNAASRESGEPQIVGNVGGRSVWWKWVAPASASVTIDTRGSYFDTKLGVYTGASVSGLSLVAENDDESASPHINTSLVTFNAVAGTTYYIAVDGFYHFYGSGLLYNILPDTGDITLHVNQAATNVAPTISNPANSSVSTGSNATFTITATGNPAPTLQWQRQPAAGGGFSNLSEGGSYSGVTSATLTVSSTTLGMSGDQFRCVATNVAGTATSAAATLTVITPLPPSITSQPSNSSINEGSNTSFSVTATSNNTAPTYVWQVYPAGGSSWSALSDTGGYSGSATSSLNLTNASSLLSGNQYRCVVTNSAGSTTSNSATLTVTAPAMVLQLAAGRYHSLRLDTSPNVLTTGTNTYGQLYNYNTTNRSTPQQITVGGGQIPVGIAAGAQHTVIVTSSGQVWSAGINDFGQLGDGTLVANANGVQTATGAVGVAAGLRHTAILKGDGTLWTLGGNDEGQLGNGTTTDAHAPVQIATNVIELAAGIRQTLFIKADGTLWGTGDLYGTVTLYSSPIQIDTNVKSVAAGGYHSLYLKNDGTVWALGYNPFGQLGTGNTTTLTSPVQIATGVKAVATGFFHSLFIKNDNSLWAFGRNDSGQLGDGTSGNYRTTPYQMATNVATVSASESYTLFTKTDGSLWGTGLNGNGQFGNGTLTTVTSPVRICGGILASPSMVGYFGVATNAAGDRFNLTWNPTWTASGYEIWRGTTSDFASATRIASNLRWTFYQDANLTDNTTYFYWVTAVNPTGTSSPRATDTGITYHLPAAPSFSAHPANKTVNAGENASFTVTAAGYPAPTLQWQRLPAGSGTWSDLVIGGSYGLSGANTLYVYNATAGMSGDQFRCVATSTQGTAISNPATLTVLVGSGPPVISQHPQGVAVRAPTGTSFTVAATGLSPLTYQWQYLAPGGSTWNDITYFEVFGGGQPQMVGYTTATLTLNYTYVFNNAAQFRCVVTNSLGSATSNAALLLVGGAANDFNGDGKSDIILQNMVGGDRGFWLMNGTGISSWVDMGYVSPDWRIAATADFNGDGKPDFLWENTITGDRGFWLMNGTAYGSWVSMGYVSTDWRIAGAADFNGDGQTDILWENTSTGVRGFWIMNGTAYVSWVYLNTVSTDWRFVGAGDFNGDGKADILMENTVTGDRGFWLMNGTAFASWVDMGYVSTDWHIAAVGDFNGDGKPDILWENTVTGDRGFWLMNGTVFSSWVDLGYVSTDWRLAP